MDKSNIAFALISVILGIYIAVALLLSRLTGAKRRYSSGVALGRSPRTVGRRP
ncbi:MAG: hypothetical protein JWO52_7259 [Gammaproteobacteria bacterium]|jgi:hypothetical protein|nr:hypothetical protein [Gammaproteobacteria bacterium]